ncbi:hypothetical protein BAUCODRAFT_75550 [Baudoinia panamericana UAMH 10762]|uniref:Thiamine pyrophosphate enzyme N-terminal TPP-binding domain-containing protein n=1 Tax=Baudoinia panamericana (strain UAMH 10762) TaxID=717646 RepID=M2N3Q8_BAUPA|nr:uncharacterized protein BAUCODRAFT_75550 [Baudoinia panamericana UAMH 10762]EMC93644.1 hypothetical protein BAUCODRAFT_75550 [Baudoinia panamericana UAMH 10762]
MTAAIPLVQYLFRRLKELRCHSLHGVPGDFFLRALDHVDATGLRWVGNANEICAGYATDGYARAGYHAVARRTVAAPRVGALFTTYGVGELSASNAVAGSYAESIPLVHLVGTPCQSAMRPIHHTLADGRMGVYAEMAKQITCMQTNFHESGDHLEALQAYDEMLETCVLRSKPVYASIPSDLMEVPVPASMLEKPLRVQPSPNEEAEENAVVDDVVELLSAAERPLLIADGLCYPFDFLPQANALAQLLPTRRFLSVKGVLDESNLTASWRA